MAKDVLFCLSCVVSVLVVLSINGIVCSAQDYERKTYIVYMGSLPTEAPATYSPTSQHLSLLQEVVEEESSASGSASLLRSYKRSFNGFVAKLTEKEAQKLASKEEVFSLFPSQTYHVQTTRSWDFIGLPEKVKRVPTIESDTIIGVFDTGADPTAASFSGEGFGPPPSKWKGTCKGGANFTCNNKLIGARDYAPAEGSVSDVDGHGTHTASTAAGNAVLGATFFGLGNGTARGAVPSSRIAVYKVCNPGCATDAILAAFDDAIADGVDIITISIAGNSAFRFDEDAIAIGAFHAVAKGVLVTHSAGNRGPDVGEVYSVAPWLLTVAANSIDRQFITKLVLGDGTVLSGPSINGFPSFGNSSALVYDQKISNSCVDARFCPEGCIDTDKVAGKIMVCNRVGVPDDPAVRSARGIILKTMTPDVAYPHAHPVVALDQSNFEKLLAYYNSTSNPEGQIMKGETGPNPACPVTASYSSRGPNSITPDIMKVYMKFGVICSSDVSAPGTDILAAYPPNVPPSGEDGDDRSVKFNALSGTSMSCPHAAGAAAYVKTFHPDWSPSAIKSALMTTASKMSDTTNKGVASQYEYSYGSGQINPAKAIDPGLIYEITKDDYLKLLCSLGFNVTAIDSNSTCIKGGKNITAAELNYPSLSFKAPISKPFTLSLNRTVTNVGPPNSTYKAKAVASANINITVIPDVLSFKSVSEKKAFTVEIVGSKLQSGTQLSEEIVWSDNVRNVRSPIIVYTDSSSP